MTEWVWATKDGVVSARNGRLMLRAERIRRDYKGEEHASISIIIDGHDLEQDLFNLLRSAERTKLAKKAWAKLGGEEKKQYDLAFLDDGLARFCKKVWPEFIKCGGIIEAGADEEPPPPTFALKPYVMNGGGTIMFAPPGAGKSNAGLLKAVSIDAGCDKFWPVEEKPALFINLERSRESIDRRVWRINRMLGLPTHRRLRVLQARGRSLSNVHEQAQAAIKADGYEVVFLDSISRAGMGDLNANEVGNATIDLLNALTPTWFAIGHPPRADGSHLYGSQMFDAGEDIGIKLNSVAGKDAQTLGIGLQVVKANDMAFPPMQVWAYEFDAGGLTDVRLSSVREFPKLASAKPADVADQLLDFLQDVGAMSATDAANELGLNRQNVSTLFTHDPRFCVVRKEGKSVLYGAKSDVS